MISYRKLRILLIDRGLRITNVCKKCGLSTSIATKLNNDESVTIDTLAKICLYLDVPIQDIIEIKKDSA